MGPGRVKRHSPFFHILPTVRTYRCFIFCHLFILFHIMQYQNALSKKGWIMTKAVEETASYDHYKATLEDDSLVMKP